MSLNLDRSTWTRVAFGDIATNVTARAEPTPEGSPMYIGLEHLDPDSLNVTRWGSEVDLVGTKMRMRSGDVLFARRNPHLRRVAVAPFDGLFSAHGLVLRANAGVALQPFLAVFMSSDLFMDRANRIAVGSISRTINWRDLAVQEFDLPPIDEQTRIAELLWAVELERRAVTALGAALDKARSSARDELVASLQDATVRFADVCTIPSQNGLALKKSERAGDVPMVNMGEMFVGEVISTGGDYERVVAPGLRFILAQGDLLFARRSIVFEGAGACCLVPVLAEPHTFESSIIRSRVIEDVLDPRFALHFFRSERGRDLMSSIVRRGPVSGIAGSDLRELRVPLPDLATQRRIVERIELASSTAPVLTKRLVAASRLQRTLSADFFGGL